MKAVLFGCGGQVGWELQRSLAPLGKVMALSTANADFRDPASVARIVREARPDVVVNAAAYTAVDRAESERDLALCVNAEAPGAIAQAAQQVGALMVHYSTDYVFDGGGAAPWREGDSTGPLSVYGSTKLEGERRIVAACDRHLIFRTSWVYAARGGNFAKTMLRLAKERDRLTVIDDQFGAPTGAELLADVTALVIRGFMQDASKAGTYHVAAGGETSWHGYARFVIQYALEAGVELRARVNDVAPVPTSAFPTPAQRPHNSRLHTEKVRSAFGISLPDWTVGVTRMLQETL